MIGLIKKDLFIVKRNLRSLLLIILVFSFLTINGQSEFSFFAVYMSVVLMMSTFSYDEYNKSDAFIRTLPNGRSDAVKAKYISTLIIEIASVLFSVLLSIISGILKNNLNIMEILEISFYSWLGILLVQTIFYPIIYKFGIEKGRIGIFLSVFGVALVFGLLSKLGININIASNILKSLEDILVYLIPIGVVILFLVSYKISKKIYSNKEY